jgi:hypothetical protein
LCGRFYSYTFQVGADLGLLGLPVVKLLGAGFFFHDLAFGFLGNPGIVGEIDFCDLVEVGLEGRGAKSGT